MGKSSKDKRDAYYRLAKEQGWRARSAFKLLQLDEEFNLFKDVTRVVDLCAAPGSWSQVLSRVLIKGERFGRAGFEDRQERMRRFVEGNGEVAADDSNASVEGQVQDSGDVQSDARRETENDASKPRKDVKIVAIDLQPMSPLEGITMLRADITHPTTVTRLLEALDPPNDSSPTDTSANTASTSPTDASSTSTSAAGAASNTASQSTAHRVDLILSDGAPDVTGLHDLDIYIQSQLLFSALSLALRVLKPGGTFVAKIFRAADVDVIYTQLRLVFEDVTVAKPRSSRASSLEAFVVCRGFVPVEGLEESEDGTGILDLGRLEKEGKGLKREKTQREWKEVEEGVAELEMGSSSSDESDEDGSPAPRRWIAPFLACGDLSAFDADATYALPEGYERLDPVQPPTAPPYKKALEERRREGGMYGKTKRKETGKAKRSGQGVEE
ncbi:MAG: hypothetical protein Q9159_005405 [Coniocarpon cinnabarinum]